MKKRRRTAAKPAAPPKGAPSRVPAALSVLEGGGLEIKRGADDTHPWTVAGRFYFWPVNGMWRSIDGKRHGYTASALCRIIKDDAGAVAEAERRAQVDANAMRAIETALQPDQPTQDHQNERVPT